MEETIIELKKITIKKEGHCLLDSISLTVNENQAFAIIGPSGSGKTTFGKLIAGYFWVEKENIIFRLPTSAKRIFVSQQHDFRYLSSGRSYYQQRFDNNYGNDFPVVKEALQKSYPKEKTTFEEDLIKVSRLLQIDHLMESSLIELSNGEGKRVQLAQALLQQPKLIVLDNPFLGLDKTSRKILRALINELIEKGTIIFLITQEDEIPEKITNVLMMGAGQIKRTFTRVEFENTLSQKQQTDSAISLNKELLEKLTIQYEEDKFSVAVEMKDVTIQYDSKVVLDKISWKVRRGERWALMGPNGSGKSTLLSLITADNPKSYLNEFSLFDKRRGSGESIWEIKEKIGQVSPELHIYFHRNTNYTEAISLSSQGFSDNSYSSSSVSCFEVICSGYYDQVGFSNQVSTLQHKQVEEWMELFNLSKFKKQELGNLSLGEQRLVLLARALVKNPPLLILDEPCQGLDKAQTRQFVELVDEVCRHSDKTLIYVSHYPEEIPSCVDKAIVLDNGRVSYCGSREF